MRVDTSYERCDTGHLWWMPSLFYFLKTNLKKKEMNGKVKTMNRKTIGTGIGLLAFIATCAAGSGHTTPQQSSNQSSYTSEQDVREQLEAMTASGYFSTVDSYRNDQIDRHPDEYMNELQNGARIALKHAPNAVYEIAIDQYAEDVGEYMQSRIYTMQLMNQKGGFSLNYDLNEDE